MSVKRLQKLLVWRPSVWLSTCIKLSIQHVWTRPKAVSTNTPCLYSPYLPQSEEACGKTAEPCGGMVLSRGPLHTAFHSLECLLHFLQTTLCPLQYASSISCVASLVSMNCMKSRQGNILFKDEPEGISACKWQFDTVLTKGHIWWGEGCSPMGNTVAGASKWRF